MKLYFTSPLKYASGNKKPFEIVAKLAEETRVDLLASYREFASMDAIRELNDEEAYQVFREAEKALKDADMLIADITVPSNRVGYEIGVALANKKPVLAIADSRTSKKLAPPVQGNKSKHLSVLQYDNEATLEEGIHRFIMNSKKKVDTKFILIISPQIDKYLEWAASERRQHKAQIVRDAVEGVMEKDRSYHDFLKDQESG